MKTTTEMQLVPITKLVPYVNNARTHSPEQINKLRSSLREFGFINPVIIDRDYGVIAGHGRILAAKEEGITEVPCVFADHLTEAQKKAYIIADNRMAMDAGWDEELLRVEIESLQAADFDPLLTGFDEKELSKLFDDGIDSAKSRTIGYEEECSPTLRAGVVPAAAVALENHPTDSRVKLSEDGNVQTLTSRMGTGGNNVPLVMKIRSGCEGGGKGPLIQENKSATLSCNNDQTLFEPCGWDGGQISPTLTKQNAGGNQRMPDKDNATHSNAMRSTALSSMPTISV